MLQHAAANNERLRKVYPKGFTFDAAHAPHITLLQCFVRTADLQKLYAAEEKVFLAANLNAMKLEAFKYYYAPADATTGVADICAKPSPEILKLQSHARSAASLASTPPWNRWRYGVLCLFALQHRGQEAAGIAVADGKSIHLYKDIGLVTQVFTPQNLDPLCGDYAIGHTRYSTTGSSSARNAQPFLIETRHGPLAVFRMVPVAVRSADELGLSHAVQQLCQLSKGLVLVTGPTGSGKSTTLAAMVDLVNRSRTDHILTIETRSNSCTKGSGR